MMDCPFCGGPITEGMEYTGSCGKRQCQKKRRQELSEVRPGPSAQERAKRHVLDQLINGLAVGDYDKVNRIQEATREAQNIHLSDEKWARAFAPSHGSPEVELRVQLAKQIGFATSDHIGWVDYCGGAWHEQNRQWLSGCPSEFASPLEDSREEAVLDFLLDNPSVTTTDVMRICSVSRSTARRILTRLVERDLLYRNGKGRSTSYGDAPSES